MADFKIDSGDETQRPFAFAVIVGGVKYLFDDVIVAARMAGKHGTFYERLYTGGFVNRLQQIITELRAERVELQDENESLRHDLTEASAEIKRLVNEKMDHTFTFKGPSEVKGSFPEADIAALAERLANVEATLADQRTTVGKHGASIKSIGERITRLSALVHGGYDLADGSLETKTTMVGDIAALTERLAKVEDRLSAVVCDHEAYIQQVSRDVHKRIDGAADTIGARVGDIVDRLVTLEDIAKQRGERLTSLEERQHQDDLDRAAGEGMADRVPMEETLGSLSGIDGLTDETIAEQFGEPPVVRPTHENGQQAGGPRLRVAVNPGKDYGVGDWVKVGPCRSIGGQRDVNGGWYEVTGVDPFYVNDSPAQVQIKLEPQASPVAQHAWKLVWIAARCVIDASPSAPLEV